MYLTQGKHREFHLGWNVATLTVNLDLDLAAHLPKRSEGNK